MLKKAEVYFHPLLVFVGYIGNACKETSAIMVGFEVGMVLGEIELERRITNDIVKFTQFVSFFMIRVFQRIALYNVRQEWLILFSIRFSINIVEDLSLISCVNTVQFCSPIWWARAMTSVPVPADGS